MRINMNFLDGLGKIFFFSFLLTILFMSPVEAQIFNGAGFTIVDGGGRVAASCSTVAVSGITTNVNVRSVSINNLNHTWIGDTQTMVYRPGAAVPPVFGDTISSPPDDRACNFVGTYRYIDTAAQTVDAATAGPCASATNVAPGDYRTSDYFGASGAGGPPTSLMTIFGTLTPAQANGNWLVCVFDYVTPDGGTVGSTSLQLVVPTAANASVSGKVSDGKSGIARAVVSVTDGSGMIRTAKTNSFGYFQVDQLPAGQTYVFNVSAKGYTFAPQVVTVNEDLAEFDFSAL
jgi:hypothetical protein